MTEYCRRCSHEACNKCGLNIPELETFETIHQWATGTFGPAEPTRTIGRATEEFQELLSEVWDFFSLETSLSKRPEIDQDALLNEAADVIITLCNLPGISEAINAKMAKNRARKWHVLGDGTGYHIKEDTSE